MLRTLTTALGICFIASTLALADGDVKDKVLKTDDTKGSKGTDGKETGKKPAEKGTDKDKKNAAKGTTAKVLKVDVKKRVISVELAGGKKQDYEIGEKVQFLGPRNAASAKGISDDRLAEGSEIRIVMDAAGKAVKEIHLPMREGPEKKPADKGKKPADKSAEKGKDKESSK